MDTFATALKQTKEIGHVIHVSGTIVLIDGLPGAKMDEKVFFETGEIGIINSLGIESVSVIVFSRDIIKVGTKVVRSGKELMIPVSNDLLGTTMSALGTLYTSSRKKNIVFEERPIFSDPPNIYMRRKITRQMDTGIALIDSLVPIGYGQRELNIGDRKTGKTQILLSALETQAKAGTICIYAAIGKRKTEVKRIENFMKERGIFYQSIIVLASSFASPGEIFIAPYTAMMLAEYFNASGKDVLLVLDDLTTHARYYREISLLSKQFPGRDSYPGDIFHMHAKLLERAGNFIHLSKESSITALPVAETVGADMSGYIQTNLMSMTDGHIYCDSDLFFRGRRPSINPFLSVTRVGRQTQTSLGRDIGGTVVKTLTGYERALGFVRFGADVSEDLKQILTIGEALWEVLSQGTGDILPKSLQYVLIAYAFSGIWDEKTKSRISQKYMSDALYQKRIESILKNHKTLEQFAKEIVT
jgi:F-type H+-transporting ATPase subunit alpha